MKPENTPAQNQQSNKDLSEKAATILMIVIALTVILLMLNHYTDSDLSDEALIQAYFPTALGAAFVPVAIGVIAFFAAKKTAFPRLIMVLTTAVVATAAVIGNSDGYQSGSYDECMLDLMEDQDKAMYRHAGSICEYRYPYEKELDRFSVDLNWAKAERNQLGLGVDENSTKYRVTRANVVFSEVICEEASDGDFKFEKEFNFNDEGLAFISINRDENYKCMQTKKVWGKRVRM